MQDLNTKEVEQISGGVVQNPDNVLPSNFFDPKSPWTPFLLLHIVLA